MTHSGTVLTPRAPAEVFDLLANPKQFAQLLPNFESMAMQDATHFLVRIAIALGEMSGHANIEMELAETDPPAAVAYRGQGTVAGSQLSLALQFRIAPADTSTHVTWEGSFSLDGGFAFMMAPLIEAMGREHFERMNDQLRQRLNPAENLPSSEPRQ